MNTDTLLTVVVASLCIFAAGVSATTLESTVSQDPDDVVDVNYTSLPIGEDDGDAVTSALNEGSQQTRGTGTNDEGDPGNPEDAETGDQQDTAPGPGNPASGDGGSDGQTGGSDPGPGAGMASVPDSIWGLLLRWLLLLLVALALVLAAWVGYRHRGAIAGLLGGLLGPKDDRTPVASRETVDWPPDEPPTEVHRAWLSLVDRIDVDRPWARTPGECANEAVDEGLDPSGVRIVTEVFEEVRYSDAPVTDDRRRRARQGIQRVDDGIGSGTT